MITAAIAKGHRDRRQIVDAAPWYLADCERLHEQQMADFDQPTLPGIRSEEDLRTERDDERRSRRFKAAIIDGLLTLPFPGTNTRLGYRSSGPNHHVYVLQASQDFWDDRSEQTVEAAEAEIDTTLEALVAALTVRWGRPEVIDLDPYLWREGPAPEPMKQLCHLSGEMLIWRRLEANRWVAVAVGQGDPELPIELLVA